jgi:hypothetical protein
MVIGLVGVGFSRVGFHHPHPSQVASWLYALQATVSLEGKARQLSGQLTLPGELLRVGLRFTGPVLLALAVLSIRGRVNGEARPVVLRDPFATDVGHSAETR